MKFNINDYVRVKLTDRGLEVHRQNFDDSMEMWPNSKIQYKPPIEDDDGFSKWQLWSLMEEFGMNMGLGCQPCFHPEIELVVKDSQ